MAEKKSFWSTMPGLITGIAAIVTGLAALIPIILGISSKSPNKHSGAPAATQSASATPSGGSGSGDTGTPTPGDTSGAGSTESPSPGSSGSGALAATPSKADWGRVGTGSSPQQRTVTFNNQGSDPVTIDGDVTVSGPNASAFSITSTTCGKGTTITPGSNCQVVVTYTPALGSQTATLSVPYRPPPGSSTKVALTATGTLL
jgi:hypothetical protein